MEIKQETGDFSVPGCTVTGKSAVFTFPVTSKEEVSVCLYDRRTGERIREIPVPSSARIGRMYSTRITGPDWENVMYLLRQGKRLVPDRFAHLTAGREIWADASRQERNYRVFSVPGVKRFSWRGDRSPRIPDRDLVLYHLHMRGFTMLQNVPDDEKGNWRGFLRRLRMLKGAGVNCLQFMPLYDFEELKLHSAGTIAPGGVVREILDKPCGVNYWGYTGNAFYFAPKASYFGGADADLHMKEMVRRIHAEGMEIVMEFSFPEKVEENFLTDCLLFWMREYHIDGFRLIGPEIPMRRIAEEPLLCDCRIFCDRIDPEVLAAEKPCFRHLYVEDDGFLYPLRKLQNHKDGSITEFANMMKRQNGAYGFVNAAAALPGFTLRDAYSYAEKHNEANGEDNRDGQNFNFSENYGVEGDTTMRTVVSKRLRHMRTALAAVLLAQGVPLIQSGDLSGNTQGGNNNPYGQDNPTGWVSFEKKALWRGFYNYAKKLIAFRKAHPVLSGTSPFHMTDYRHTGLPDLSYHGREPWTVWLTDDRKAIGIMYCGAYAPEDDPDADDLMLCFNFYLGEESFALPHLLKGREWFYVTDTASGRWPDRPERLEDDSKVIVPGGSMMILKGTADAE